MSALDQTGSRPLLPLVILHDYFQHAEGGGRLCLTLSQGLKGDLAYGFKAARHPFFAGQRISSVEHDLGCFSRLPMWKQIKLIRSFSRRASFLKDYRTAVYSGFYSPCAVVHHPARRNIYYCHTPPRYIYDQREAFRERAGRWRRPVLEAFIRYYRPIYEEAVSRMDLILTNSENVRQRIRKYLGRESLVIYPPCDTSRYCFQGQDGFYLSLARLDPLKRVDLVVRTFREMPDRKLVVISGGPEEMRIRDLAQGASNIQVLGWVDEETMRNLIGRCIATIYIPRDEDFGMSPVESMAAGKPVIGVAEGGLLESVIDGLTGLLLPPDPAPWSLAETVRRMSPERAAAMRQACEQQAIRFDQKGFLRRMAGIIAGETIG
jgi:glycosyltransferase involved in cell wall biosynthesis